MFELVENVSQNAVIKVVGVGGGGGNAVRHMLAGNVEGVEFICANTDSQALKDLENKSIIQLGSTITKGLGAGANPEIGRQAALEDRERIAESLRGADMVFIFDEARVQIDPWGGERIQAWDKDGEIDLSDDITGEYVNPTQHFVDILLGKSEPSTTPENGVHQSELMDAIYESAKLGRAVNLSELVPS